MGRFKLFIRRFDEDDIRITVGIQAATNSKSESQKIISDLDNIEEHASTTMSSLKDFSTKGADGLVGLKNAVKDLLKQSEQLSKTMSKMTPTASSSFTTKSNKLEGASALKETKIGFTGGASDDITQLLKEASFLYGEIFKKTSLIRQEEQNQVKLAEQQIANLTQENALKQQQQAQDAVKISFENSYTDIGGNAELTAQYREQYNAILSLLSAEEQETAVKKLMNDESKKRVNSAVSEIQALKEAALNTDKNSSSMSKLKMVMGTVTAATDKVKNGFKKLVSELKQAAINWRIIGGLLRSIINTFVNLVDNAAAYEESLNLYTVAMGDYADQATEWANRISEPLYLDPKDIMQYAGAFYNLTNGLGASSDAAYLMSTNLTQLSYDMSSYLNIDVEAAQAKIQSAITGQARAVASAGVAMQQASLQELAYELQLKDTTVALNDNALEQVRHSIGIKKSVKDMTQAEKTYLRYIQIMRSTTHMQGDLARTIVTPANAMRVMRTQFTLLGRSIGQVFIPILMKVIPYIMLLTQALQRLARWLGKKLGYEVADIDYSSLDKGAKAFSNLGDYAEDAAGKAKKAGDSISRSLAPFDNLNVVESESSGAGGDAGIGGGGASVLDDLEEYLTGYDMLNGLTDKFNQELEKAKQKLKDMMPLIITIGALFLGWKLATGFMKAIMFVSDFLDAWKTVKSLPVFASIGNGLKGLLSASLISDLPAAFASIAGSIQAVLAGSMSIADAWTIFILPALETIAAVVGGIVLTIAGIFKFVEGIKDIINGNTFKGIVKVIEGIALVVAGIALLFGGWIVAAVAAVVAVVAAVVEHWDAVKQFFINLWEGVKNGFITAWNAIVEFFTPAIEWIGETVSAIGQFFVDLWDGIVNIFTTVVDWVDETIITPLINLISPIVAWFAELFSSIFETLKDIGENIIGFIRGCWEIITIVFSVVSSWFNENVIQPVYKFFKKLWTNVKEFAIGAWEGIKKVFITIGTWIYDNIISPVTDFFSTMWKNFKEGAQKAWEGVKNIFSKVATFFKDIFSKAWEGVRKVFSIMGTIFEGIKEGIFNAFCNVVNAIIDGINTVVSIPFKGINKALEKIKNIEILDYKPFENKIHTIDIPQIPHIGSYEQGGYPTSGELFFANENGKAEYITSVGNKTAVANQDQMITAITNAILTGMQSIETGKGITQVYIGNEKVYEGYGRQQNRQADRYGTTLVKV